MGIVACIGPVDLSCILMSGSRTNSHYGRQLQKRFSSDDSLCIVSSKIKHRPFRATAHRVVNYFKRTPAIDIVIIDNDASCSHNVDRQKRIGLVTTYQYENDRR